MKKRNLAGLLRVLILGLCVGLGIISLYPDMPFPTWSGTPTPICVASGNQFGPQLIKVADGYIVAWQDERRGYRDIYSQKFDADGNMKWADNGRVIAAGNTGEATNHLLYNSQNLAGIVGDTQGGAILIWSDQGSCSSGSCIQAWITRVHANGDVQWGAAPTPSTAIQGTDTAVLLNAQGHADAIAPDGEGGAFGIVDVDAWGNWYVFRLNGNGAYRSGTSDVVGARSASHMIYGGNSGGKDFVNIAWWDYGDWAISVKDPEVNYPASVDTLYAPWSKISLSTTPAWWSEPSLVSDGAGGAVIVWEDGRNGNSDIFAQKIGADGSVQWTTTGVPVAVQPGDQRRLQIVSDGAGGAVVVWDDSRTAPTQIYAQHIGGNGSMMWAADGIPISSTYGESPKIIRSDDGAYIIAWFDTDHNGGTKDYLRAQKVDAAGSLLWPPDSRTPSGGTTGVVISEMYAPDFDIASDGSGGLVAVWELSSNIYATKIGSTGFNNTLTLNRSQLNFGSAVGGAPTQPQDFMIGNSGTGTLNWTVTDDADWLTCTPSSGTGNGQVTASVSSSGLGTGTYSATITVSSPNALQSPQTISVTLKVYPAGSTGSPFGVFETPVEGTSGIEGSVPVTGWVLDDIEVTKVDIWRDPVGGEPVHPNGYVYIGDAVFVEGARPDVEAAYPAYPLHYRAGWGYMMLTNFLPGQGNGSYRIHAIAYDKEGHSIKVGAKTITCDNAHATLPFGAIDTPAQGGTWNGTQVNFGWALTPMPKSIPIDGSTIWLWIDGLPIGHPTYNNYRPDIATFFPGFANSNGAVGYYYVETTKYANGVHSIAWSVDDSAGKASGIGSRYFAVVNVSAGSTAELGETSPLRISAEKGRDSIVSPTRTAGIPTDLVTPVHVRKGYKLEALAEPVFPDAEGVITIEAREVDRVEVALGEEGGGQSLTQGAPEGKAAAAAGAKAGKKTLRDKKPAGLTYEQGYVGNLVVGSELRPLPIGSTLDTDRGVFSWQLGPGFIGEYNFVFISRDGSGSQSKKNVRVRILPAFQLKSEAERAPNENRPKG